MGAERLEPACLRPVLLEQRKVHSLENRRFAKLVRTNEHVEPAAQPFERDRCTEAADLFQSNGADLHVGAPTSAWRASANSRRRARWAIVASPPPCSAATFRRCAISLSTGELKSSRSAASG